MERCGIEALPIVALISFLMGLISAFQAAVQLRQFGADIYVANLVGLSITRELGPLMTAIIAAGRSGAAFAAEIGTMKVSEEVDAMAAMGLDRTRFLVTPKVLALVLMLPCLTLFADLVGILGGLFVAVFTLDLPVEVYFRQMRLYMVMWDINLGLIKSIAFAFLIAGVGCLRGFQASAGAESVGRITTSAIVSGSKSSSSPFGYAKCTTWHPSRSSNVLRDPTSSSRRSLPLRLRKIACVAECEPISTRPSAFRSRICSHVIKGLARGTSPQSAARFIILLTKRSMSSRCQFFIRKTASPGAAPGPKRSLSSDRTAPERSEARTASTLSNHSESPFSTAAVGTNTVAQAP